MTQVAVARFEAERIKDAFDEELDEDRGFDVDDEHLGELLELVDTACASETDAADKEGEDEEEEQDDEEDTA